MITFEDLKGMTLGQASKASFDEANRNVIDRSRWVSDMIFVYVNPGFSISVPDLVKDHNRPFVDAMSESASKIINDMTDTMERQINNINLALKLTKLGHQYAIDLIKYEL